MTPIRIILADDHTVLRAGLVALLTTEPDIEVIGEAEDGLECLQKAIDLQPDVILMDINMPRCNGLEALERIREASPESRVLILTMHDDLGYLRRVLGSGGAGYVLKQAASEELLTAIRTVHEGGVFLHPHHAQALAEDSAATPEERPAPGPLDELRVRYESLSAREAEVFKLIALGHQNSEIAEMMFLSVKTIETYKSRLMSKIGVDNRAALVRLALELGVLS